MFRCFWLFFLSLRLRKTEQEKTHPEADGEKQPEKGVKSREIVKFENYRSTPRRKYPEFTA